MTAILTLLRKSHRLLRPSRIKNAERFIPTVLHSTGAEKNVFHEKIKNGPDLKHFIDDHPHQSVDANITEDNIPYLDSDSLTIGKPRKVFFSVYGCQMNVNDTEIVWSILKKNNFVKTDDMRKADVVLLITCAIRESAETKIWDQITLIKGLRKKWKRSNMKIGILGCMAERLKEKLIEKDKAIDLVAGPDSYKDLPRLLALTENNQTAVNVLLSLDETYADVMPVRLNENSKTAFVSIMRGCDNMCTYCIVPFTRGKERSRPIDSISEEIKHLSEQGVKEVTLLGQNVNSYRDLSLPLDNSEGTRMAKGFSTVYKTKKGGLRFADLLERVASVDPEMRIRFTSPHPKDFPDDVLDVIKNHPNICKSLHIPAQSGNSSVLERMRRGYTRENYLELIDHIRSMIPNVSFSSDFICGFCGETEDEFEDTISLMERVKYNVAYLFLYSMREKTTAHRRYKDDVPGDIKQARLLRMIEVFRRNAQALNAAQVGEVQLILIEGPSKKSEQMLAGRNDGNIKVIIPSTDIPNSVESKDTSKISPGDYVAVLIESSNSQILKGTPLFHTTLNRFSNSTPFKRSELKLQSVV